MNLLITGATGFIGAACVRAALARGHRVAGLSGNRRARVVSGVPPDRITWIDGDLAQPDWGALARFAPETCIHTAWVTTPGEYLTSPANRDFLAWSMSFLKGLAKEGLQHCLALGTCIEYAPQHRPLDESTSPVAPSTTYAQCKNELRCFLQDAGFDFCWARIFYPYGPGEDPRRLPSSLVQQRVGDIVDVDVVFNTVRGLEHDFFFF